MSFKASKIMNDKEGYTFKYTQEEEYNNERPNDQERWGTSEATNEERRPSNGKGMGKAPTACDG